MDFLKSELVLLNRIKHYDREAKGGQSIEVPFVPAGAANDKAANTQVTLNGQTATKVSILINKHKESSYIIEDLLDLQQSYDLRSEFTKAAAYAIAEAVDTDIITELKAGSTNTALGAFGTPLTYNLIVDAQVVLDAAKAPTADRTLAIDPFQYGQLLKVDNFVRYDALGKSNITNGVVGEVVNFTVVKSQNIPFTAGTPDQHTGMAFHKDAMAIAMALKPRTQAQYKQEYLGWLLTVDTVYGVKTLRPTFSVAVRS